MANSLRGRPNLILVPRCARSISWISEEGGSHDDVYGKNFKSALPSNYPLGNMLIMGSPSLKSIVVVFVVSSTTKSFTRTTEFFR